MNRYYIKVNDKVYFVNDANLARISANYYAYEDSELEEPEVEYGEVVNGQYKVIEKFKVESYGN